MHPETERVNARFTNSQPLSAGRIVHFVALDGKTIRPAMVVRVWGDVCANLQVFYDGSNDSDARRSGADHVAPKEHTEWATSICFDAGEPRVADESTYMDGKLVEAGQTYQHYNPRTWHWPPRA